MDESLKTLAEKTVAVTRACLEDLRTRRSSTTGSVSGKLQKTEQSTHELVFNLLESFQTLGELNTEARQLNTQLTDEFATLTSTQVIIDAKVAVLQKKLAALSKSKYPALQEIAPAVCAASQPQEVLAALEQEKLDRQAAQDEYQALSTELNQLQSAIQEHVKTDAARIEQLKRAAALIQQD